MDTASQTAGDRMGEKTDPTLPKIELGFGRQVQQRQERLLSSYCVLSTVPDFMYSSPQSNPAGILSPLSLFYRRGLRTLDQERAELAHTCCASF